MGQKYWSQFYKFYLFELFFLTAICALVNMKGDKYLGWVELSICMFLLLQSGLMIAFYEADKQLSLWNKLPAISLLYVIHFLFTFCINYFNLFDRGVPTQEQLQEGLMKTSVSDFVLFIISIIIVSNLNNKLKTLDT